MPPEQAVGAVGKVDPRSDVFGLGAILCVILTGHPPFVGADAESTRQLAARAALGPALTRLDACGADPELIGLCKQCLSAEPADRPAEGEVVAAEVARLRAAAEERARQADLDRVRAEGERAKAEAETREQRKRRKVQLALAAAVGLLVCGAGVVAWWLGEQHAERERVEGERREADLRRGFEDERRAADEQARAVRNAEAVAHFLERCEAALRADDLPQARLALEAAARRASEGGADRQADRLDRCRADVELLARLNDIDERIWTPRRNAGRFATDGGLTGEWAAAFAAWGLVPGTTPPAEAARRLTASPVADAALTALERWFFATKSADLLAVLRAADPDAFRDAMREGVAAGEAGHPKLAELLNSPAMFDQPPRFAVVALGAGVYIERAKAIFDAALRRSPGSFRLLMDRGNAEVWHNPSLYPMREGCYRAAVAVRPDSATAHMFLGIILEERGDAAGAAAEFRRSLELDGTYPPTHVNLGNALRKLGKLDEAIASYREAVRLSPRFSMGYYNLGIALSDRKDWDGAEAAFGKAVELDPRYAPGHQMLGRLREHARDDPSGAVVHYRKAIDLDPNLAAARVDLARAQQKAERAAHTAPPPRPAGR
jgi:tetratricopeptide (TPR) repeat protein